MYFMVSCSFDDWSGRKWPNIIVNLKYGKGGGVFIKLFIQHWLLIVLGFRRVKFKNIYIVTFILSCMFVRIFNV